MSMNSQVLLEEMVKQEKLEFDQNASISDFFEFYSAAQVLKNYELSYDEIEAGITGESHDGGADSIFLFVNGDLVKEDDVIISKKFKTGVDIEFIIIQSKYENKFSEDPLLKLSRMSKNLLDFNFDKSKMEKRYNEKVITMFELFKQTYFGLITKKPKLKISYYYVSKGIEVHPNVQSQADDLKKEVIGQLPSANVSVSFVGAEELMKITQKRTNDVFRLSVSENPMSSTGQVFIALVNLADYFRFITDDDGMLIKYIFESNVRDYQGKTNVNNEIQDTLENDDQQEFWWLNNGVTIIASEASAPGGKEIVITNPEIVNGLQTSSEIHRHFALFPEKLNDEKRNLLVRIIVPQSEETRDKIIRATNSQTPIPKSSLRATDPIHRQIEDYMKPRELFYDRRKNFYKNEGRKPKDIISVSFMAQCVMSVLMQRPDSARARPSTLLEENSAYSKLYNKNNALHTYHFLSYAGRQVELYLKESGFAPARVNNIRFYVLYAVCVKLTNSLFPSDKKIAYLSIADIQRDMIKECTLLVDKIFTTLGGNDKISKGTKLLEKLKEELTILIN